MPSFTSEITRFTHAGGARNGAIFRTIAAFPTITAGGATVSLDIFDDFGHMHAAEAHEWLAVSINIKIGVTYRADPGVENTAGDPDELIRRPLLWDPPSEPDPVHLSCTAGSDIIIGFEIGRESHQSRRSDCALCNDVNGFVLLTLSGGGNVLLVGAMLKNRREGYFLAG